MHIRCRRSNLSCLIPSGVGTYDMAGQVHWAKGSRKLVQAVPAEMANGVMRDLEHDTQTDWVVFIARGAAGWCPVQHSDLATL